MLKMCDLTVLKLGFFGPFSIFSAEANDKGTQGEGAVIRACQRN